MEEDEEEQEQEESVDEQGDETDDEEVALEDLAMPGWREQESRHLQLPNRA